VQLGVPLFQNHCVTKNCGVSFLMVVDALNPWWLQKVLQFSEARFTGSECNLGACFWGGGSEVVQIISSWFTQLRYVWLKNCAQVKVNQPTLIAMSEQSTRKRLTKTFY
jgi:hypothetical protein